MPELPEVETIRRTLSPLVLGRRIEALEVGLPKLLLPDPQTFRRLVLKREISSLERKGKYLILKLSPSNAIIVHFKLTGQLVYLPDGASPPRYTHLRLVLDKGVLAYADLRQFGRLEAVKDLEDHPQLNALGPEPFFLDEEGFWALLKEKRRPIKALLLDQKVIAGLGNIYVDESLFRAGIHPRRPAYELSFPEAACLLETIKAVLEEAIATGGSSVRNYVDGEGRSGRFQERHQVYGRRGKPCPRCGTPIAYTTLSNRGTHFCPNCQK